MSKEWCWQDFSYVAIGKMDSRRAAFLLHDFINMFEIEDFRVIQQNGEWQNARIEIVYKCPANQTAEQIEDKWYEYLKSLGVES